MVSRRDALKIGASLVVGLGVGFLAGSLMPKGQQQPATASTTAGPTGTTTTAVAKKTTFKLAVVSFQTGPASVFGIPAINAAKMLVDQINASGGILGAQIQLDIRDESGGPDKMVTLYRQLVEQEGVDAYIGLISSADCLAVAPVAEEIGQVLTLFFDCATKQLVDNNMMKKVVFRPAGTTVTDGASLARYVVENMPNIKTVVGLNQDYAYGHDEWNDFKTTLLALKPDVQILDELFTPLFTSDYSAQISKILSLKPDLLHTSFWGPDLVNLIKQGTSMGLFKSVKVAFARGEFGLQYGMPDGQIVQGPNYHAFPSPRYYPMNNDFITKYKSLYGDVPSYPAYHMANAVLALKAAYEAAAAVENVEWPDLNAVVKALERLAFATPGGYVVMTPNHNAMCGSVVGMSSGGELVNIKYYDPSEVNPPYGYTSSQWYQYIKTA